MADLDMIVEEISKLSLLEASELVTMLEDKLGVSAAAPMAMAAMPMGGAAPAEEEEEQTEFNVIITEIGPKLQKGITWRVYDAKAGTDGQYRLISTHRESAPSASLLPGEYLVNVAYGLSNLTKKIKVEKDTIIVKQQIQYIGLEKYRQT